MPTTNTVSQTLGWVYGFVVGRPTTGVGGFVGEPGLTSANLIAQTILAAPFAWNWNRATQTFLTVVGQSDYPISISQYGYIEKATVFDSTVTPPAQSTFELEINNVLAADGKQNRPVKISPVFDNDAGTITFRLFPIPDKVYTVTLIFQKAPLTLTLTGNWAPIPDKYAFLYERGLKAMMHGMYNPQIYMMEMQLFLRQLVGASQGLTEMEKAIFLDEALRRMRTENDALLGAQQGKQVRA